MSPALSAILAALKGLLPGLEPIAQGELDTLIKNAEAEIAAGNDSPDWKVVEENLLGAVQMILDAEGAKLAKV
jgi:hypothetical protein